MKRPGSVLANASFRRLWLAGLLSLGGTQVARIGLLLHLFEIRGEVAPLALLVVLETLPGALAAPLAGAVVDRLGKRGVLIAADLARAAVLGVLLLHPTVPMLFAAAALHSLATAFFKPAKSAAVALLFGPRDLPRANGADQSATNLVLVAAPVLGAHLLLAHGLAATLVVDLASYLLSAALLVGVRVRRVAPPPGPREAAGLTWTAAWSDVRDGWRYLARHRLALHLNLVLFAALVCTSVWVPLAPFFIRDHLGASEGLLGWQLGLFGAGAVAGGLAAPALIARFGRGVVLTAAFVGEAALLSLYAAVADPAASTAVVFAWGIMVSVLVVPFYSLLQAAVDEAFLGRVFSVVQQSESLAVVLAMALAAALQGVLASHLILLATGLTYLLLAAASAGTAGGRALLATR